MRHTPAARLPAADFTGSGSVLVDSKASSKASTPTLAAVSPNLDGEGGGDARVGWFRTAHLRSKYQVYFTPFFVDFYGEAAKIANKISHATGVIQLLQWMEAANKSLRPQKHAKYTPAEGALQQRERNPSVEPWNASFLPQCR